MGREMDEQPSVLAGIVDRFPDLVEAVARLGQGRHNSVVLLGRGSSDNAAVLGRYAIELATGRPVALAAPSLITRYHVNSDYRGVLVIALSQSGQTPEINQAVTAMRMAGASTMAIINNAASPLAGAVDLAVDLVAGDEIAVPATKTVTAQMLVLLSVVSALGSSSDRCNVGLLPDAVAETLADDSPAVSLAERWVERDDLLVVARGLLLCAALETALKVRECAGLVAVGSSSADLLHGPIAAVRPGAAVLVFDGDPATDSDLVSLMQTLEGRGVDAARPWSDGSPPAHRLPPLLAPIVATVRGQQVARALAKARGLDPDSPLGLTKITRTY